ncbi:hypothetical protein B4064_2144 [Caldibacillus thermoamylovorans]|uniref:Uncharacterized protein n=1 Tax=Caldibacillus thermoamylovorans TaxID=35841 RepID=A0A0D0FG22_9BACI|nr:hypothetical protein B4166_2890 [Caldibacillus thermoamylovorans]KIO66607.1 hypothetical protein B4064_2144 [Caldibacillus thermoamylovorans]KIO67645.1 hypothetical protein B4065_1946 [Caldibacillus thermoamylovorans]KIO72792.1 hypothetical protein B4167_2734 [Caldibacillus thermoamylovorans]
MHETRTLGKFKVQPPSFFELACKKMASYWEEFSLKGGVP